MPIENGFLHAFFIEFFWVAFFFFFQIKNEKFANFYACLMNSKMTKYVNESWLIFHSENEQTKLVGLFHANCDRYKTTLVYCCLNKNWCKFQNLKSKNCIFYGKSTYDRSTTICLSQQTSTRNKLFEVQKRVNIIYLIFV